MMWLMSASAVKVRFLRACVLTAFAGGLAACSTIDEGKYEKGRKVSDEELAECNIKRHAYHGEWNYEIHPRINK